jgi:hypothetical protein
MNSSQNFDLLDEVELLDPPGGSQLRLRFSGPFEGEQVVWQASLFTPPAWATVFDEPEPKQNIIEIGEEGEQTIRLSICLKVPAIDHPTVRKAVMMVRQYKRLRRGRHVYG